jgi:iron complex outermembrane receptor protein
MKRTIRMALWASVASTAFIATAGIAQTAAAPEPEEESQPDIIVTGTSRARIALDTPLAVSSVNAQALSRLQASGQADVLNSIPSIKADGGGGEVAANVFVRGLPSGGQYQFTPLMYDGMPVMSTFGLNSSAFDVYYRNDLGIERLEFVRGGVSNLFGPGSVAGLINYITATGGDELHGTIQLEAAERGRYRGDVAVRGPLAENLFFAVSGFYRYDDGPMRTNLPTKGGQVRANLKYEFPDNSGSVTLYGQYIDDKAVFYLPVPLDGTTRHRAPGNDGQQVYQVLNNFGPTLGFNTPAGQFTSSINDGVATKGGQVAIAFDKSLGDVFGINGRAKYSDYKHKFGLWSDGDGLVNVPESLAAFVTNATRRAAYPELNGITAANATYTYVGGGAVPANATVFANRFTDRDRPMTDFSGELNLTAGFGSDAFSHKVTLGGFYAKTEARDINVTTTYLAEFNNTPRLINLTVTNPISGATTIISRNGLLNAGAGYVNNYHKVERYAGYIADQIDAGRFKFDVGFRIEQFNGYINRERTATTITDATTPNLSAALRDVIWGAGTYQTGNVSTNEWAAAAGALYKVSDEVSLYLNASRGYFFPEIRAAQFNALNVLQSFQPEIIKQVQGGIKVSQPAFTFEASAFYTNLSNRRQVLFVNDGAGGFREAVNLVGTRSFGVEAVLDLRLMRNLRFNGNMTLQSAQYTEFTQLVANVPVPNPAIIGNDLERQPNLLYNAGLYYDDGALDVSAYTNYTGDNYTASANTIELKGWNVVNFDAGYKIPFGRTSVRIGVNVFNVFDNDSTTEGSPRQDNNQTVNNAYFVGRPVLPRRITGRVTFNF